MHTVALIDDEKYALSDIRHTFPFKAYGFSLVAALTDPIQALEISSLRIKKQREVKNFCRPHPAGPRRIGLAQSSGKSTLPTKE